MGNVKSGTPTCTSSTTSTLFYPCQLCQRYPSLPSSTRPLLQDQTHPLASHQTVPSILWQPNFPPQHKILKHWFDWTTLHDIVNKSILAPAVRRFHMKCGVPERMTALITVCLACRIAVIGQGSDWWLAEKDKRISLWNFQFSSKV